jgi:hypothetical protein
LSHIIGIEGTESEHVDEIAGDEIGSCSVQSNSVAIVSRGFSVDSDDMPEGPPCGGLDTRNGIFNDDGFGRRGTKPRNGFK